jgi:hypothetical protein
VGKAATPTALVVARTFSLRRTSKEPPRALPYCVPNGRWGGFVTAFKLVFLNLEAGFAPRGGEAAGPFPNLFCAELLIDTFFAGITQVHLLPWQQTYGFPSSTESPECALFYFP